MPAGRAGHRALFGLLFFLSGAAGLVYEQLWIRELQHFFGSTIHSITTVVAAYMGGLGLGAWVMGRRADRHRYPAVLYGVLELAIGVFGIASPLVFGAVGAAYSALARTFEPGLWAATAIRFLFAFSVMLLPTFLMGGTLPILTRAFTGESAEGLRRELALFYGLNTVGAVAGCLLAGVVLVEHVGLTRSLLATGVLNLVLGAAAIAAVRRERAAENVESGHELAGRVEEPVSERDDPAGAGHTGLRRLALWLIALTAFASLLYEIAWTRVLVLVAGSSTYAFTTILASFLLGIGLGSLVAIGRGRPAVDLLRAAAIVQGAIAVLASLLFPFFGILPLYIVKTLQIPSLSPSAIILLHSLAITVVVMPPAVGMGLIFPLLTEAAARRSWGTGGETGRAYLCNTAGSIAGSVVTGFFLIHSLGTERTLQLGVLLNAALALFVSLHLTRRSGRGWIPVEGERVGVLLGALALVVALLSPSWSTRLLDRGPAIYGREHAGVGELDRFLRGFGTEQLSFDEGWNAAISVWRNGGQVWLKSNGKVDASSVADMDTQVMVGLLPALVHPRPRRVLVVGLGSGVSARTSLEVGGVESVDVVEIERAVVAASRFFRDVNGGLLSDPRVRLIMDDARSALQAGRAPYDVIVSEPSNPWVAGVASLFTPDYFRVVKSRLAGDGVFAQWLQMYRVPVSVVSAVVSNLREVFPYIEIWYANESDLVLLAANRQLRWRLGRVTEHFDASTPTGRALRDWVAAERPLDLLGHFLLGNEGAEFLARQGAIAHTDDRPALEFVAARGLFLTGTARVLLDSLVTIRQAVGDTLPHLDGAWRFGPGEWMAGFAAALPSQSSYRLAFAESALARLPNDPSRRALLGRVLFEGRQTRLSLPHLLEAVRADPQDSRSLLLAGVASSASGELARGRALLERARTSGGDSVFAMSVLAETAVGQGDYARAAELASAAIRAVRPTIAAPFPGALESVIRRLAQEAPPELAAPVLAATRASRPGWDVGYHSGTIVYLRRGAEYCGEAAKLAAELTRFGWTDSEILNLVRSCLRRS